jgi:hypothetical protein
MPPGEAGHATGEVVKVAGTQRRQGSAAIFSSIAARLNLDACVGATSLGKAVRGQPKADTAH